MTTHRITHLDDTAVYIDHRRLSWETLRSAACQDDPELAATYRNLLDRAEATAATQSPVVITVRRDHTHVWWVAQARAVWGGGVVRRAAGGGYYAADEGGTLASRDLAAGEAQRIAERVRRDGRRVTVRFVDLIA